MFDLVKGYGKIGHKLTDTGQAFQLDPNGLTVRVPEYTFEDQSRLSEHSDLRLFLDLRVF